jgi:hypothetical protein
MIMDKGMVIPPTLSRKPDRRDGSRIPRIKIKRPITLVTDGIETIDFREVMNPNLSFPDISSTIPTE